VDPYSYLIQNTRYNLNILCAKTCAKLVKKVISLWILSLISIVFNRFHRGSTDPTCGKV
jgi:hypothetical protein